MIGAEGRKVFLSSTFLDLADTRARVSQWLSDVFGAELIVMETAGSDAAPPDVSSVRRVSQCDLFVGIYAHRYGTVDKQSGKSITELELDEATRSLSAGTLTDILLYVVDEHAPWPNDKKETGTQAHAGLLRLKEKAGHHTCTPFKSGEDVVRYVVRDVYKRVSASIPAGGRRVRRPRLPSRTQLRQPIGMEFLSSADRDYLTGRDQETTGLLAQVASNPVVLLLGDSGVGKTSLIHAGLFPKAAHQKWRVVYTRPLGLPCSDVANKVFTSVYSSGAPYKGPLLPLLDQVARVVPEHRLILVIDQFEDVLASREEREVRELVSAVRTAREIASPSLRILIVYRADLEGRLGEYWQAVSGSPEGLPRVYLSGITTGKAWDGIMKMAKALSIGVQLDGAQQECIKADLVAASAATGVRGVYPPYIQMLVDHISSTAALKGGVYTFGAYQQVGGVDEIIGGYLGRLLRYAQDSREHVRLVLISLVRSYGTKAQKSIQEVSADTGMSERECDAALEQLIDLRLVRHIDPYYEVSHDFIARRIASDLVDSEEHEFKRFRELLASKAAAFDTTRATLTSEELLVLYKHRGRVAPSETELHLLLSSWVKGAGPALYWLLGGQPERLLDWLRTEEARDDLEPEAKASAVLLRQKIGAQALIEDDYRAFRHYQLSIELAALIARNSTSVPPEVLIYGLRHDRGEVREASEAVIAVRLGKGEWDWLERLRKSSSVACRRAYEHLALRADLPSPPEEKLRSRAIVEFFLLRSLASADSCSGARAALRALKRTRAPGAILTFAQGLFAIRSGHLHSLLRKAQSASAQNTNAAFAAIGPGIARRDLGFMLSCFEKWARADKGEQETPALNAKTHALAAAILRSTSCVSLSSLRRTIKRVEVTPASRGVVLAILKHATVADVRLVLGRIGASCQGVELWNHAELGRAILVRMEKASSGIPRFLAEIARRAEFWEYFGRDERSARNKRDLLPIMCSENRALYIRLVAHAVIGLARKKDADVLVKLAAHGFGLIAREAATRLVRLLGKKAFPRLLAQVDDALRQGNAADYAAALRSAEMASFGVIRG